VYRFLIIIEKANENYSAYSSDLPGCVATGATREETERNMYEVIEMHIQGLLEDNLPIPESNSFAECVALDEKSGTFADIVQTA
jgi:predicted RNase H-like HicB family nuclease